jgi:hypothetical protein
MVLLLVQLLFCSVLSTTYTFSDATVEIQTVSSGTVLTYSGETNPCSQLRVRSNQVYHISTAGALQISLKGHLDSQTTAMNLNTSGNSVPLL